MKRRLVVCGFVLAGCSGGSDLGVAIEAHGSGPPPPPPEEVSCWITAGGQIDPDDGVGGAFGGNAKSYRDGSVDGEWNHVTFEGDHFHGDPVRIVCFERGDEEPDPPDADPVIAIFGGACTWNGSSGYAFEVTLEDLGEPGRDDFYRLVVCESDDDDCDDATDAVVYDEGDGIARGNMQIHPPNNGHP